MISSQRIIDLINIIMLKGIKVIQFEGLAPSVFCGMYFADQGADVVLIARAQPAPFSMPIDMNLMNRGKKCVCLNPKKKQDREVISNLLKQAHVVIDPYRPGVLEKLGFGPNQLSQINPKAVLLRVSGYGQTGKMAMRPGHDLNYLAYAGILPLINEGNSQPQFPTNFLADFVSSSLGVSGTLAAMQISLLTGKGGVVDCSLSQGCRYLTHLVTSTPQSQSWKENIYFKEKEGTLYCITSLKKESEIEQHLVKMIEQMRKNKAEYLASNDLQISVVKKIPKFEEQLKGGLKNPFDSNYAPSMEIPSRGSHNSEFTNPQPKL